MQFRLGPETNLNLDVSIGSGKICRQDITVAFLSFQCYQRMINEVQKMGDFGQRFILITEMEGGRIVYLG